MHNGQTERVARGGLSIAAACLAICCAALGTCSGGSIEQDIEKMAVDFNRRLPKQVDAITRLDRIEAGPGRAYAYVYTLGRDLSDSDKQQIREATTRQALALPELQPTFKAGVTVWYKYFDGAGNKVLEFPVRGQTGSEENGEYAEGYRIGYRIGYVIGAFFGGFLVGVLCGSLPLFLGIRRGRRKLAVTAMVSCSVAGLILGLLLAVPTALVFTVVIFAMPRVVPEIIVVKAEVVE